MSDDKIQLTILILRRGALSRCEGCYRGPSHRGPKSGCKLVTEFDSYSDDGVNAVIGVQHTEVPNLGASW